MSDLEIFKLSITLAQALQGEAEAIADLKVLFKRHPEMFKNLEELRNTIKATALEPEIIVSNSKPLGSDIEVISAKKLDERKMGDIGIRNEDGTNVIFHANKKRIGSFESLEQKAEKQKMTTDGRDAHTPYTQAQSLDGRLVQKNISSVADTSIIAENPQQSKNRLVINIFGSAGVGKTTLAVKMYNYMNMHDNTHRPAFVKEFATNVINSGKAELLQDQPFITKNQIKLLEMAFDGSNLLISDSPVELGNLYNSNPNTAQEVSQLIADANKGYASINLLLLHNANTKSTYTTQGRIHTFEESEANEKKLLSMLDKENIKVITITRDIDMQTLFTRIQSTQEWRSFEIRNLVNESARKVFSDKKYKSFDDYVKEAIDKFERNFNGK